MFALIITTNVHEWEAFHSIAGEIMFLPWLGIYIVVIMFIEGKITRKLQIAMAAAATNPKKTASSTTTIAPIGPLDNNNDDYNNNNNNNATAIHTKDSLNNEKDKF
jgi:hypothetical protein